MEDNYQGQFPAAVISFVALVFIVGGLVGPPRTGLVCRIVLLKSCCVSDFDFTVVCQLMLMRQDSSIFFFQLCLPCSVLKVEVRWKCLYPLVCFCPRLALYLQPSPASCLAFFAPFPLRLDFLCRLLASLRPHFSSRSLSQFCSFCLAFGFKNDCFRN